MFSISLDNYLKSLFDEKTIETYELVPLCWEKRHRVKE